MISLRHRWIQMNTDFPSARNGNRRTRRDLCASVSICGQERTVAGTPACRSARWCHTAWACAAAVALALAAAGRADAAEASTDGERALRVEGGTIAATGVSEGAFEPGSTVAIRANAWCEPFEFFIRWESNDAQLADLAAYYASLK